MSIFEYPMMFPAQGVMLAGRVYRNVDNLIDPQPAVAVTGSWLTVKEQMPHTYALQLAELGYTAFTFDFTGFGESGGQPRQLEHPSRKIADIIAAADFLSTLSFVRDSAIGHLGICASAQYALAAIAAGARIQSFASVAGWYHDASSVAPFYGGSEGVSLRLSRAREAQATFAKTGETIMVPAYDPNTDRAGMFFEFDYYANRRRGAISAWRNEMAEMSWLSWLTFDGLRAASRVRTPTAIVHSDDCVLPDNVRAVYAALQGPKQLEWGAGGQMDYYDQMPQVKSATAIVDRHFRTTLISQKSN